MLDRAEVVTKGGDARDFGADIKLFGVAFAAVLAVPLIAFLGLVTIGGVDAGAVLHAVAGIPLEESVEPAASQPAVDQPAIDAGSDVTDPEELTTSIN